MHRDRHQADQEHERMMGSEQQQGTTSHQTIRDSTSAATVPDSTMLLRCDSNASSHTTTNTHNNEPTLIPVTQQQQQQSQLRQSATAMDASHVQQQGGSGGCTCCCGPFGLVRVATRKFRIMVTLVMAMAIVGIAVFGSTNGQQGATTTITTATSAKKSRITSTFDVNAPPGLEERVDGRKQQQQQQQVVVKAAPIVTRLKEEEGNTNASETNKEQELPFPVIHADDDEVPFSMDEKAVDALECRESVINFVINATDAKDECNGLKKAFDMTCNSDSAQEIRASADGAATTSSEQEHDNASPSGGGRRRRRRLLFDKKQQKTSLTLRLYQMSRWLSDFVSYHFRPRNNEMFFPEDEIMGVAWRDASFQVLNDYDGEIHDSLRRRLQSHGVSRMRFLEEMSAATLANATVNQTAVVSKPSDKKVVSLSMPTNKLHASEKMLSDTLMLGKEKDIQAAIKASSSNQTNATLNAAQEDAVASSKAIHDTAAAVSAVLNDPESVEARTCCASILNVYHEHCDTTESNELSDSNLFLVVFIIAFCGVVKSLIRHFKIRWLPEAAGCILVGVLFGCVMSFIPHYDLSFDGDWFLRIMVPPIVFEAALSIDKRSFQKHIVPILVYAIIGTLFASAVTAFIVHKGTSMLHCETIPYVESLTFGALISSIDPIAVLSVLSNLGMTDTDAIYVIIFGESLLNDGIAMVLFQTLVHFMDTSLVIDQDAFVTASVHFLVVALGSVMVGLLSGMACTCYFYAMKGCQTPLVEVLVFFCWAFLPYYICDGVEWSGIVAIVTTGIVMDLYVVGQDKSEEGGMPSIAADSPSVENVSQKKWDRNTLFRRIFSKKGHLSAVARTHVGFVTEILATMMETAIFSYLGFFLFSYRYHWNFWHVLVALLACCVSRAIMIPTLSLLANWITSIQQSRNCRTAVHQLRRAGNAATDAGVTVGGQMQMVLWFAGLRGAMSFALVENIPLYDAVTGEGSRMKAELKAMTSACIIFTVFVMGGCTDYVIERLGMGKSKQHPDVEMTSLLSRANDRTSPKQAVEEGIPAGDSTKHAMFRQRGSSRI